MQRPQRLNLYKSIWAILQFNQKLLGSIRIVVIITVHILILIFLLHDQTMHNSLWISTKTQQWLVINDLVRSIQANMTGRLPISSPLALGFATSWQGEPHRGQQLQPLHAHASRKGSRNCSAPPSIACLVKDFTGFRLMPPWSTMLPLIGPKLSGHNARTWDQHVQFSPGF